MSKYLEGAAVVVVLMICSHLFMTGPDAFTNTLIIGIYINLYAYVNRDKKGGE